MKTLNIITLAACLAAAGTQQAEAQGRFSIGGYGEAAMSRNFYSDHIYRYKYPYEHKDDPSHGRFDLPHFTINVGYDFGRGWTLGTEVEFEHGGTESAVEYEPDESGEYEAEIEKGGEVALEQMWINKAFLQGAFNIRAGELIVPVAQANAYHMPDEFFTVYRPEGESTILPNTWHQTGISLWGRLPQWRYEIQFISGLDSERFGSESFVHYGAVSPYEFKIANSYAGVFRIDNYSIKGIRMGISGYYGHTFNNTLSRPGSAYDGVHGALAIGSADMLLDRGGWIARANATCATLADAGSITSYNNTLPLHHGQDGSPSKHQPVGDKAVALGAEAGYNILNLTELQQDDSALYVFSRFEYYHSMAAGKQAAAYDWCGKKRIAAGINYMPVKGIIIKAEYSHRFLNHMPDEAAMAPNKHTGHTDEPLGQYNNEPSFNIGIAFTGWFFRTDK